MQRITRHIVLAAASFAGPLAAAAAAPPGAALDRVSLTLSWLCLLLLASALLVGPAHTLRTGRLLTNSLLRRDLGIWSALTGLAHLVLAFEISMTPAYIQLYVDGASGWPGPEGRREIYQWAVIGSLIVAALFGLLLVLSNNLALRGLGPVTWKRLQRSSYVAFALTVAHSVAFQLIESRSAWLVAALVLVTAAVVTGQLAGWASVRSARRGSPS